MNQMLGAWKIKHPNLRPLAAEARALLNSFDHADIMHVRRELNTEADALGNRALDCDS